MDFAAFGLLPTLRPAARHVVNGGWGAPRQKRGDARSLPHWLEERGLLCRKSAHALCLSDCFRSVGALPQHALLTWCELEKARSSREAHITLQRGKDISRKWGWTFSPR